MQVRSLGWEDPLEKEMATHSSILAWEISWTESLLGYSPWGYKEPDMSERLSAHIFFEISMYINLYCGKFNCRIDLDWKCEQAKVTDQPIWKNFHRLLMGVSNCKVFSISL